MGYGFSKTSVTGKLLCGSCGTETELYKFKVLSCIKCDYQECYPRDDKLETRINNIVLIVIHKKVIYE